MRSQFVSSDTLQGPKIEKHEGREKKMYHALLTFYKTTIVPAVRWSFERAGNLLDLDDIRNPVQLDTDRVLARIAVPCFELDGSFIYPDQMGKGAEGKNAARKLVRVPKSSELDIRLHGGLHSGSSRDVSFVWPRR
jgi:hypothetical protein